MDIDLIHIVLATTVFLLWLAVVVGWLSRAVPTEETRRQGPLPTGSSAP